MVARVIPKQLITAIIVLTVIINQPVFAQLSANNLTQYGETDGLPSNQVHHIMTDQFGYIWIGTANGLTRFDGYEFKRFYFNPNDDATIHGLEVESIFEDHNKQIWIGAEPSYLNAYDPVSKTFRQYAYAHLIDHPANVETDISAICEDNKGRIYFGVSTYRGERINSALLFKEENEDTLQGFKGPDSLLVQNIYAMTKDQSGAIWILCYNGMFKVDANHTLSGINNPSLINELTSNSEYPTDIKIDRSGDVWLTDNKGHLYDIHQKDGNYKVYALPEKESGRFFYKIGIDQHDIIWIGTNNGVVSFDRQTGKFGIFNNQSEKQLEKAEVTAVQFDDFGTLWIGTATKGLLKYEQRAEFRSFSNKKEDNNSIGPGWVTTITETRDGKVWLTTSGGTNTSGAISEVDLKTNTIRTFPVRTLLPGSWGASCLYENNPGELLINNDNGNWLYSINTGMVRKAVLNGVPDSIGINQFYRDSKGNFWLCTLDGLFRRAGDGGTFRRYDLSTGPGSNSVSNEATRVIESAKHGLWIATNNGLYLYDYVSDKIERHGFDKSKGDILLTQDVNSFYEDKNGILWVGTWQGGLSAYNPETKKIKTYTQNDGLPSMSIQGILPDDKNDALWLSTFEGISRMDVGTRQFNNFSVVDGLQSQLFADGAFLKTQEGLFVFGGSNGITIFNPDEINKKSTPPRIFLTDLKLFDKSVIPGEKSVLKKPVYNTKEIILDYNQNNISLEFIAIHYSNPSKNKYAYKLENYDNDWREIGNQHAAFYPNLPPGEYIFHVKAANNNGVWNEQGATLSITVKPPWWKTTGAYIIYGLLLIAFAFGVDRYFRHRIVQKERERNQARELVQAKEIEKAYHELKVTQSQLIQSEKMASLGELTAGIAHEIQNPLNFVNNFSEVNTELIDELLEERHKNIRDINKEDGILDDIKENEKKINHHGKRADAIVKGMLQHSRSNSGEKEQININSLADEYLRLSYHGLRAKDHAFNATLKTDFDQGIGTIRGIPQDLGRVLLNLYNNAFYAVNEKRKSSKSDYEPTVTVTTRKSGNRLFITVSDNGSGIPQNVVDKIFQPFFTTKPTGQGTGLGLSLSYDIIKAHGGQITVETVKENDGTKFIIELPA